MSKSRENAGRSDVDWRALYDAHPEYAARRSGDSFECQQIDLEVRHFKLPLFHDLISGRQVCSALEIGCATGELIAGLALEPDTTALTCRLGVDISPENVKAAKERFPEVEFLAGDFRQMALPKVDAVVLSDVLEHVPDDVSFLTDAAQLGRWVLLNLPLEDNWLNRRRNYGPEDGSGHLRAYSLRQGLQLVEQAGLRPLDWRQIWAHELPLETMRRELRRKHFGQAYAGGAISRRIRAVVMAASTACKPIGRRLFASNLFVLAEKS